MRLADVRRHHFTQRPGFLAGKGWGSGEEGEEEPGAKANGIYSSLCVQKGQQQETTWPLLLQLPLHPGKRGNTVCPSALHSSHSMALPCTLCTPLRMH